MAQTKTMSLSEYAKLVGPLAKETEVDVTPGLDRFEFNHKFRVLSRYYKKQNVSLVWVKDYYIIPWYKNDDQGTVIKYKGDFIKKHHDDVSSKGFTNLLKQLCIDKNNELRQKYYE